VPVISVRVYTLVFSECDASMVPANDNTLLDNLQSGSTMVVSWQSDVFDSCVNTRLRILKEEFEI